MSLQKCEKCGALFSQEAYAGDLLSLECYTLGAAKKMSFRFE
jgi:hypothetical protein